MGQVRVSGPHTGAFLNCALVGNLTAPSIGRAKYSLLCTPEGGIVDDLITYRLRDEEYLVLPNGSNTASVIDAFSTRAESFDVCLADESATTALVAVQGPNAEDVVRRLVPQHQHTIR